MTITLRHGCCQIETCASDLNAVRTVLVEVLGGVPVEQELARQIADLIPSDYAAEHIDVGRAVFQINRPPATMNYRGKTSVHQGYLDAHAPA